MNDNQGRSHRTEISRVVILFTHASGLRNWGRAVELLSEQGIDLAVAGLTNLSDIGSFACKTVSKADVVYLDIAHHMTGFDALVEAAGETRLLVPGNGEVEQKSGLTLPRATNTMNQYLKNGTVGALIDAVYYLLHEAGLQSDAPPLPDAYPDHGFVDLNGDTIFERFADYEAWRKQCGAPIGKECVALLLDRQAWQDGDTELAQGCARALAENRLDALSLVGDREALRSDASFSSDFWTLMTEPGMHVVAVWNMLLNYLPENGMGVHPLTVLDVPVFQVLRNHSQTVEEWRQSCDGLSSIALSYGIMQPETFGAIEPSVLACSEPVEIENLPGTHKHAVPMDSRIHRLAARTKRWATLQSKPNAEKRVAVVLHNTPCKGVEASLASAIGLDAAESTVRLMRRLQEEGYALSEIPESGEALLCLMLERKAVTEFRWTNAAEIAAKGGVLAHISEEEYLAAFHQIPQETRQRVTDSWGTFPGEAMVHENRILVTGLDFGNVTVLLQPKRGCYGARCDGEVCRILHNPDLAPSHHWLATYFYLQQTCDAVVHMGAHGALEYLPGKSAGLSETCFPEISIGGLPNIYPYVMSAVGESLVAKRRGRAVTISHLSPPEIRQDANPELNDIESLYHQWHEADEVRDARRSEVLKSDLVERLTKMNLQPPETDAVEQRDWLLILPRLLGKLRQRVADGAPHILGHVPDESALKAYLAEAHRGECGDLHDIQERLGRAACEMDTLVYALNGRFVEPGLGGRLSQGKADILPTGRNLHGSDLRAIPTAAAYRVGKETGEAVLGKYYRENGEFPEQIALTFWSSDVFRSDGETFSQALWLLGCRPAWNRGTRVTGFEIIPTEELTIFIDGEELSRPRVDVLLQMSGVARDMLPSFIEFFDDAVQRVVDLDEPPEVNCVRAHVNARIRELSEQHRGADETALRRLATLRAFSSKRGAYGNGLGYAIDASAWNNDRDLAEVALNWGGNGYGRDIGCMDKAELSPKDVIAEFAQAAGRTQIAFHRRLSAQSDPLSSSYSSFQGAFHTIARGTNQKSPEMYWADTTTDYVDVTTVREELRLSLAAGLLSPQWLEQRQAEGYRGAREVAGRINAAFHWAASAHAVEPSSFNAIHDRYIDNCEVRDWLRQTNPHAMEEIVRRLLEADSRDLWKPDALRREVLHEAALLLEGDFEESMGPIEGEYQGGRVDIFASDQVERWKPEYILPAHDK